MCEARGLPFVCVQPLVSHIAREQEDLTGDKTDEGDSGLIARLARELHCYVPERLEGAWAELRDEGRRRAQLITNATAAKQLIRDKLGLVAPALLESACEPSGRGGGVAGGGAGARRRRGEVTAWGMRRSPPQWPACCPAGAASGSAGPAGQLFTALGDGRGITRMRRAALRRARGALADLKYARSRREQAEADIDRIAVRAGRITPAGSARFPACPR